MNDAESEKGGFIRDRRAGMIAIAVVMPVALLLWLGIAYLVPRLASMDDLGSRMLFTMKCFCLAVLFCLVTGVEAVAHERLSSPAFDPLSGFETRRLRVNQRYLQNTLEQTVVFAAALFGPCNLLLGWVRDASRAGDHCCLDTGALTSAAVAMHTQPDSGLARGCWCPIGCPARSRRLQWPPLPRFRPKVVTKGGIKISTTYLVEWIAADHELTKARVAR